MYKIKTPGDKIMELRKSYKIRQHEISGNKVTRNLISLIENNKASLTPQVAEIIASNFNQLFTERGIDNIVSINYLIESTESQMQKVLGNFIAKVSHIEYQKEESFETELIEIEKLIKENDHHLDTAQFYLVVAKVYELEKDFQSQYIYLLKAFNDMSLQIDNIEVAHVLLKLCSCSIKTNRYEDAIKHSRFARTCFPELTTELDIKLHFNTALAYKKMGQYSKALESIDKIILYKDQLSRNQFTHLETLKANCLKLMNYHTDAIKIHKSLLESIETQDIENLLVAHCNLIEIYIILNDTRNIERHVNDSLELIISEDINAFVSNQYLYIINDLASALTILKRYSEGERYYRELIKESKFKNEHSMIEKAMQGLYTIYLNQERHEDINNLKVELMELIKFKRISNYNDLVLRLIGYFTQQSDTSAVLDIVNILTES